jgi:hypothetical protein
MRSESSSGVISSSATGTRRAAAVVLLGGVLALGAASWSAYESSRLASRPLSDADRGAVADSLRLFLTLSGHLRAGGGDARYADRLPVDPMITDEIMGEVQFLARAHRVEIAKLVKLEVVELRPTGFDGASARTKEYWITREERSELPPRSDVVLARYELRRHPRGWQIVSWDVDLPAPSSGGR